MKSLLSVIPVALFSLCSFAADDAELPLAAKNVISTMERQVADIQKKAVADLKDIMQKEAKAGRMDTTLLLNNIIKQIEDKIDSPTLTKNDGKYDDKIIGRWSMPMVKYEITFEKSHRFSGKFGENVEWKGTWKVDGEKLIVSHPINNSFDTFDLPPKRESAGGKTVYKLYGHTEKGEGRVLVKQD